MLLRVFFSLTPSLVFGSGESWDERDAEHLLNRAGFGARPHEIEQYVALGREGAIERLFAPSSEPSDSFFSEPLRGYGPNFERELGELADEDGLGERDLERRRELTSELRRRDRQQMRSYTHWWLERMLRAEDPLRDRMTLFWHGYFTSSYRDVKNSFEMIRQHEFLRDNALGAFDELLRGIAKDPAMLEYLDNDANRKRSPNENFARELLELFTLGEGNFTEQDVLEAARSFTGWTDSNGEFVFRKSRHDDEVKTFMGVEGELDGDAVLDILLEPDATPESRNAARLTAIHLSRELLMWFEGREPEAQRVESYADDFLANDWALEPVLRRLFGDAAFYTDDVRAQRIAGPVDFVVGTARRIGVEPPLTLLDAACSRLGQRLFHPPDVEGWDPGRAWISTTTMIQRGNFAGAFLGEVGLGELLTGESGLEAPRDASMSMTDDDPFAAFESERDAVARAIERVEGLLWSPRYHLSARIARSDADTDDQVVELLLDELLAVPPADGTQRELSQLLRAEREELSLAEDCWSSVGAAADTDAERLLRRTAHRISSLPDASLH